MKFRNLFRALARRRAGAEKSIVLAALVMATSWGGVSQPARAALPTITIDDVRQNEGNSGTTSFTFHLLLSSVSAKNVTVHFATVDGTALAGSDYFSTSGTRTFLPNQTSKTITVQVIGDSAIEANEIFKVNLSGAVNATIADSQGKGVIINDDPHALSVSDVTQGEGNSGTTYFTFTVTLSTAHTQTVSVTVATANDTALAGTDYTARSATISFPPGVTSKSFSVAVKGDTVPEANNTFFVNLSNPVNATIADAQGVGTIVNDDLSDVSQ